MGPKASVLGLILAGGRAERFDGAAKGMALLSGKPLILHVADSLKETTARIAINVSVQNAQAYADLDRPLLVDPPEIAGRGPLSGLLAGLDWAAQEQAQILLTAPCDAPLLRPDVWPRLVAALESAGADAAIAVSPAEVHPLCAALRPSLAAALKAYLSAPGAKLAVRAFLDTVTTVNARFDDDAQFLNVNTREDLAAAEAAFDLASRPRET
jgi:molybdenum cofactor guanylyltransferase